MSNRVKVKRPPVESMSVDQMKAEVMDDLVSGRGHTTPAALNRFIAICARIGEQRGIGAEGAYQEIRSEVRDLGMAMGYLQ